MASIFKRIADSVSADIHTMLDQKEQKNPIATLNHYLRQSEQETERVRKLVERQHRLKEEFRREYQQAKDMANKRKRQLEIAQKAGEESLAEFASKEYEEYTARVERMNQSYQEAVHQLSVLEHKYEEMKHRLKDMKLRRMELMGRENVANAHYRMNQVIQENANQSYSNFSEIEQYIENLEYKVNHAYHKNTFDSKMAQLEKEMDETVN
ncbi:PspA/IM30 family protein [Pontibacillus litoralis]|uniref:Modulator protein n=1 Tax=Pontibacillus litoralis JSM 072002 TaxID=1385512 RepID=A0A0A5HT77_9BACI|nr:PspA/IM30 family protein [Pontibacillus litoralis]KGX86837.1 modulator protein [Pontibacillus litoralis JSM 072002]